LSDKGIKFKNYLEPALHILIWGSLLVFIWTSVNTMGPFRKQDGSIYFPLIWSTGFSVILFYLNALYLVPRYILRHMYTQYTLWAIVFYLVIVFGNASLDQLYSLSLFSSEKESFLSDLIMNIQSKTVILSLSIGYGLSKLWVQNQKFQQQLIKDKLTTQIKYLKAQINPHFLFNTLNMAYASATKHKDETTAEIIEKLSGLMRYVLYESNEEKVPLEKEIQYIDNSVNLQLQRLSSELVTQVNYSVSGDWQNHKIAPMILIPFIENVFKHGIILSKKAEISIFILLKDTLLVLETKNLKSSHSLSKNVANSGIGLKNAKERLKLLYQNKHILEIHETELFFHLRLEIQLN
jgi:two-component system LytT family sensor kinase